jgi:hypothetical protein
VETPLLTFLSFLRDPQGVGASPEGGLQALALKDSLWLPGTWLHLPGNRELGGT